MVLNFTQTLSLALQTIEFTGEQSSFPLLSQQKSKPEDITTHYGQAKWAIVDMLNKEYSTILNTEFNLYHWLHYNEHDEVAYFLNEAGSNALNHSEFKAPSHFHLWVGRKGFVIGIEQQGKGFNAKKIDKEKIKENEGAAFEFFRTCKGIIFFDEPKKARVVYLEVRV